MRPVHGLRQRPLELEREVQALAVVPVLLLLVDGGAKLLNLENDCFIFLACAD